MASKISVIMPTLNEAGYIERSLGSLRLLREAGHEVIVVDGGSDDGTHERAKPLADRVITAPRGRASQMNAGARIAHGDVLWFLHADSLPPPHVDQLILKALRGTGVVWGYFNVRLSGSAFSYRVIEFLMNSRSRLSGIATGDQGIYMTRTVFTQVGGFADVALMEDIAISKRFRAEAAPIAIRHKLTTSSRRWEKRGVWRTVFLMWRLRLAYALGADPKELARLYQ